MAKKHRRKPRPTTKQLMLYLLFQALQSVSTRLASLMAYHLWFHPSRQGFAHLPRFQPEGTVAENIRVNNKRVSYWVAGEGKTVFLMHGWAGCGKQMAALAQGFLDAGFRVIWMDAPAHCSSQGYQTSLFEISESIVRVQQEQGPFEAIVAHSFGVPCSLYAIARQSLEVKCLISIASPASTEELMDTYCKIIQANPQTREALIQRFKSFLGDVDISETSAITNAALVQQACLVIHDKHDRMTRPEGSKRLCQAFPNATLMQTERLGHNKILNHASVVKACVDFVQAENKTAAEMKLTG